MNKEDMYDGISGILPEFLEEAEQYTPVKKSGWRRWLAAAVCICFFAAGLISFFSSKQSYSPFVVTAYATGPDDTVVSSELHKYESVPVSLLETSSGMKVYVFSYGDGNNDQPASIAILSANGSMSIDSQINEIGHMQIENGKHYICYVPDVTETSPYRVSFFASDFDTGMATQYDISIREENGRAFAKLNSMVVSEMKSEKDANP